LVLLKEGQQARLHRISKDVTTEWGGFGTPKPGIAKTQCGGRGICNEVIPQDCWCALRE
jgi:hypothetical protein